MFNRRLPDIALAQARRAGLPIEQKQKNFLSDLRVSSAAGGEISAPKSMIESRIKDYFNDRAHIAAVYLFGSHAVGKERSDSDVDIAILFKTRDPDVIRNLIDTYLIELSRLLKKDIHPVVLNHAGELLLRQVLKKGKCIVVNDQRLLASFRMSAFAKIFDFSYYHALMQSGLIKSVIMR